MVDEAATVRARVEFLRIRPVAGERKVVEVAVQHIARADSVAREQSGCGHEEWCVLSVVPIADA